jgi:hypothetical protein
LTIECTQCGAQLDPHKDEIFYNCPFCHSTLYIERGMSVEHYYVSPRVARKDIKSILSTWLAGSELSEGISIVSAQQFFFPFWYFQFAGERNHLTPANTSEVEEIDAIELPPVDLLPFRTQDLHGGRVVEPQFLHDVMLEKTLEAAGTSREKLVSSSLIHLPVWEVAYTYGEDPSVYTAVVDGTSGAVYANIMPAPPLKGLRTAYLALGYGSLALFVALGFAAPNIWWRLGLYAVLVPLIFFMGKAVIEKYG